MKKTLLLLAAVALVGCDQTPKDTSLPTPPTTNSSYNTPNEVPAQVTTPAATTSETNAEPTSPTP